MIIIDEAHLTKIEALAANTTPGQWHANWTGRRHSIDAGGGSIGEIYDGPNSRFVVEAHDLVPDLCFEIRRLAGIVAAQTAALAVAVDVARELPRCAEPSCHGCKRNDAVRKQIDAALRLVTATPSNDESVF